MKRTALGAEHPEVAKTHANLGVVLHGLGDLDGARQHFGRALVLLRNNPGPQYPLTTLVALWVEKLAKQST